MEKEVELDTRRAVLECIRQFPGIHLREIQRKLNMPMGSLEYHLIFLEKHRLVSVEKEGHYKRYYPAKSSIRNRTLLSLLRQEIPRRIVVFLIENEENPGDEIRERTEQGHRKTADDGTPEKWHEKEKMLPYGVRHRDILETVEISPSTLSFHLKKLEKAGVVVAEKRGRERYYRLKNREMVIEMLLDYRQSFLDSVVDRFAELWLDVGLK